MSFSLKKKNFMMVAAWLASMAVASAEMKIETHGETIRVTKDDAVVTEYRTDAKVPYLFPISTPSGPNLSRHWPMETKFADEETDHPHHRSFWMSHGSVNGFDFWAWTGKDDARITHQSIQATKATKDEASFSVELAWKANGAVLLREIRHVTVIDKDKKTRVIDTDTSLTAVANEVVFGDTKEGFFAMRVDRALRWKGPTARGGILDSEGRTDLACWGKRSKWVAFHGPDANGQQTSIVMMDHSDNLRHPTWWHARDYGLLAANPFGIHDFEKKKDKKLGNHTLTKDQTLRFRYRLVLHAGTPDSAQINELWKQFTQP